MDKKERIIKWLAALRSGEYKQGTGKLVYIDQESGDKCYCAQGVLYAISPELEEEEVEHFGILAYSFVHARHTIEHQFMWLIPTSVLSRFGFDEDEQYLIMLASDYNDAGMTFSEIADKLEPKFRKLGTIE